MTVSGLGNTLNVGANLNNAGSLTLSSSGLPPGFPTVNVLNVTGSLNNTGGLTFDTLSNGGIVTVAGAFSNGAAGKLFMFGVGDTLTAGSVSNDGIIIVGYPPGGVVEVETLTSKGNFDNNASGNVTVAGIAPGAATNTSLLNVGANLNNAGSLTLVNSGPTVNVTGSLNNTGTLTFDSSSSDGRVIVAGAFNNTGTLTFDFAFATNERVTVAGAFNNGAVGGLFMNGQNDTLTAGSVSNDGTVVVNAFETLNSTGAYTQTGGATAVAGALNAGSYSQSGGSTFINSFGTITAPTFTVSGGSVQVDGGTIVGAVSVGGGLIQAGLGTPVFPGLLISGTYTQGALGTLIIDLGGTGTFDFFGLISITGAASLDGTVDFTTVNGFTPAIGDDFTFLLASSVSGDFANLVLTNWNCPVNATCTLDYAPGSVTLDIDAASTTPTPEPATLLLLGTAMLGIGAHLRRRKLRASDALSN